MNAHGHEFWTQIAVNIGYTKLLKGKKNHFEYFGLFSKY